MRPSRRHGAENRKGIPTDLHKSEVAYRRLFETNPLPMCVYDFKSLTFMAVNDAAINQYGYSRKEFLAMNILGLLPVLEASSHPEGATAAMQARNAAGICSHRRKNGQLLEVEVNQYTVKFQGRQARIMLAREITHTRRAEQELRVSERNYRQLFENARQGIWVVDNEGKTILTNRCLAEILGCSRDEILGVSLFAWLDDKAMGGSHVQLERLKQGIPLQHNLKTFRKDGSAVYLNIYTWPLKNESGEFTGTVALVVDASKPKVVEENLQAS
jgi:PAS domain S-box-containing protein